MPPYRLAARLLALLVLGFTAAACDSGDDDQSIQSTTPASTKLAQGGGPQAIDGSPSVGKTPGAQTPGVAATPAPSTAAGDNTPSAPANTPSSFEATLAAEVGSDVVGGNPSDPRAPAGDVPTPPASAVVDPTSVAQPEGAGGLQIIVDMDAAQAGTQNRRSVHVGDIFRVAILVVGAPSEGMSAFNFFLDYDKTKVVAPSYKGGSGTDRNPDLYEVGLGDGWTCLPAPEGDLDDPGGINGDNNPETGRALLSCFNPEGLASGTLVMSTIEFRAIATGDSQFTLNGVSIGGGPGIIEFGHCEGDAATGSTIIPCLVGSVTVQ